MINFEINKKVHSCNLDKEALAERAKNNQENIFSKSKSKTEENGKMKYIFDYTNELINEISTFIINEKACCNDFIIDLHLNMKNDIIELELA